MFPCSAQIHISPHYHETRCSDVYITKVGRIRGQEYLSCILFVSFYVRVCMCRVRRRNNATSITAIKVIIIKTRIFFFVIKRTFVCDKIYTTRACHFRRVNSQRCAATASGQERKTAHCFS